MDTDDQKTSATPLAHPIIYNATLIGSGNINQYNGDNSAHAAINAKEFTGGGIFNSVFSKFETGFNMQQAPIRFRSPPYILLTTPTPP